MAIWGSRPDIYWVKTTQAPAPPTVYAPARPGQAQGQVAVAPGAPVTPDAQGAEVPVIGSGAAVTAVVPGAVVPGAPGTAPPVPEVTAPVPGVNAPGTSVARPTPGQELARTGFESTSILVLALVLVLLGVLLVRLAAPRSFVPTS